MLVLLLQNMLQQMTGLYLFSVWTSPSNIYIKPVLPVLHWVWLASTTFVELPLK